MVWCCCVVCVSDDTVTGPARGALWGWVVSLLHVPGFDSPDVGGCRL